MLSADDTARRLRAMWGWSNLSQEEFAERVGVKHGTFRSLVARSRPNRASPELLQRAAEAAGVPQWFAEHGFERPEGTAEERVSKLEEEFAELSVAFRRLAKQVRGG